VLNEIFTPESKASVHQPVTDHYVQHDGDEIPMFYSEAVIVIFIFLTGLVILLNVYHVFLLN